MGQTRRDNLKLLGGALAGVFGLAGWGVSGCAPALWERLGVSKEQFSRLEQAAAKIDPFTFPSDEEVREILPIVYESVTGTPFSTYVHGIQFQFLYDTPVSGFFNHSNRIVTYAKTPDHMKHRFATMPSYALRRIVALYWDTIFHELGHANEPETLTSFPSHAELSDYCEVKTNSDKQILNHVLSFVTGLSPDQREYHNRVKQVNTILGEAYAMIFAHYTHAKLSQFSHYKTGEFIRETLIQHLDSINLPSIIMGEADDTSIAPYRAARLLEMGLLAEFKGDFEAVINYISKTPRDKVIKRVLERLNVPEIGEIYPLNRVASSTEHVQPLETMKTAVKYVAERYNLVGLTLDGLLDPTLKPKLFGDQLPAVLRGSLDLLRRDAYGKLTQQAVSSELNRKMSREGISLAEGINPTRARGYNEDELFRNKDFFVFVKTMYQAVKDYGNRHEDSLFGLSEQQDAVKRYEMFKEALEGFIEQNPQNMFVFAAYYELAKSAVAARKPTEAIEHLDNFLEQRTDVVHNPHIPEILDLKMEVFAEIKRDEKTALKIARQLKEVARAETDSFKALGADELYKECLSAQYGIEVYEAVLQYRSALKTRNVSVKNKMIKQVVETYERLLREMKELGFSEHSSTEVYFHLADAYEQLGNLEKARSGFLHFPVEDDYGQKQLLVSRRMTYLLNGRTNTTYRSFGMSRAAQIDQKLGPKTRYIQ